MIPLLKPTDPPDAFPAVTRALSDPDGPAGDYIDLMLYNVRTIKGAILGS